MRAARTLAAVAVAAAALASTTLDAGATPPPSFLGGLHRISIVASTVPSTGDVNPYGVVVVQHSAGRLEKGDVLVSNFNDATNLQGTGSTIIEIAPNGHRKHFARLEADDLHGACPGGVGLTTALAIVQQRWVVVGSLPTSDGTAATAKAGCLIVLNSAGHTVGTISGDGVDGPWDLVAVDRGADSVLFVSNVIDGTVERLTIDISGGRPHLDSRREIGSGFGHRADPVALFIGPTGLALDPRGTLYVADTLENRIAAIPHAVSRSGSALSGQDVSANAGLNEPLGLTLAPNGDLLTVNGGDGNAVETAPDGTQVAQLQLDSSGSPPGAGALFGLAVAPGGAGLYFVDDATNTLDLAH